MSVVVPMHNPRPRLASEQVSAIVVGAGAAGIAVVGNLLELLHPDSVVLWVDPNFQGGRISASYREVPSNTRAKLFVEYALAVEAFKEIAEKTPKPNGISALQELEPEETCPLEHAANSLLTLTSGLSKHPRVRISYATVADPQWSSASSSWNMRIDENGGTVNYVEAPIVVYCTGSTPTVSPLPAAMLSQPMNLDLDIALRPTNLRVQLPRNRPICVGVIGASHSAILVLMNLVQLRVNSHPDLSVRWFTRRKNLRYAVDKGDWILFDNTGLKGISAQFARDQLEGDKISEGPISEIITQVLCAGGPDKEIAAYTQELPACDYLVQAVGYTRNPLPGIHDSLRFNHETGRFMENMANNPVPGLFGAGIAFPERVVDRAGNVEMSVGFIKFMRFLKRVMPAWVKEYNDSKADDLYD